MRLLPNVPEFCVIPLRFKLIALNASDISYFITQKAAKMAKKLSHETFRMNWRALVYLFHLRW